MGQARAVFRLQPGLAGFAVSPELVTGRLAERGYAKGVLDRRESAVRTV